MFVELFVPVNSQACALLTGASPNPEKEHNLLNKKVVGFVFLIDFLSKLLKCIIYYIWTIESFFNRKCIVIPFPLRRGQRAIGK